MPFMRTNIRPLWALLTASLLLSACGKDPEAPPPSTAKSWNLPLIRASAGVPVEYLAAGTVVSDQRIDVASRLSAQIRDILVREGDRVRRGQLLVRLDPADTAGGIRQARAAAGAAEAAYRDAQTDFERFQRLFERGSVSDNEMRKVRLKYEAAHESLNQARAGLDVAQAQRAYAEIASPADGVVVALHKKAGALAVPGAPLLTVESGKALLFETFVAESRLAAIAVGAPVEIRLDGLTEPIKGKVSRRVPSGHPVSRSYQVMIALPEVAGLLPGMFGRAAFALGNNAALALPKSALIERGGLQGVFVVDGQGQARFRWLRLGREWPDRVEVSAGLDANEPVVATPSPVLRDGDRIIATEAAP